MPQVISYSFGIQKQLPFDTMIDISYVGNLASHQLDAINLNPIAIGAHFDPANADATVKGQPLPDNFYRRYPGFGSMTQYQFAAGSNYNSLQISAQRRFTKRLGFGAGFSFSKSLGLAETYNSTVSSYFDPRSYNYGPLPFDRSKSFVVNYAYDLPDPGKALRSRPVSAVLGDRTFSGIAAFVSGAPFTPGFSTTNSQDITGSSDGARITVIGDPTLDKSDKSFFRNFKQEAFALTPVGNFGNAGVGILRGPGVNNWDVSLAKRIPVGLGERRTLQLRATAYNAFNHTQFTSLNTVARFDPIGKQVNAQFGTFTAAAPGRSLSFALRFQF